MRDWSVSPQLQGAKTHVQFSRVSFITELEKGEVDLKLNAGVEPCHQGRNLNAQAWTQQLGNFSHGN